jgi:hypothetical protein
VIFCTPPWYSKTVVKHNNIETFNVHYFTSVLDRGEWSASRPSRFTPRERAPWYPLEGRFGGPQSLFGRHGGEKNSQPLLGLKPPIIKPIGHCYTTELSWPLFCKRKMLLLSGYLQQNIVLYVIAVQKMRSTLSLAILYIHRFKCCYYLVCCT